MITKINIEFGHTLDEWETLCGDSEDYWDFSLDDFFGGAVEPNEDIAYWVIDGRIYEVPTNR